MRRFLRLALVSSLLFVPLRSVAQDAPRAESGYEGVTPGAGNPPPAVERLGRRRGGRARAQILTWPGFQIRPDGGSRFFVQTTGPVRTELRVTPERVEVIFHDTGIHLRNSARWLETEFFETPVRRARLERRGRDMVLVMIMRDAATPRVSTGPGAPGDAFQFTYVDFDAGHWAPDAAAARPAPSGGISIVSGDDGPAPSDGEPPPRQPPRSEPGVGSDDERPPGMGPRPKS